MKRLFLIFMIFFISFANAQYVKDKHYLGPSLGLSFLGSTPEIGVNYEYAIDKEFSIGGIFRYFSYGEDFPFYYGKYSYTYVFLGAQGNYHFKIDNPKIDPFAGLVLGFNTYSSTWERWEGHKGIIPSASGSSGLYLSAHGTFRYWIKPNLGLQVRINFGTSKYSALDFGVDWKL